LSALASQQTSPELAEQYLRGREFIQMLIDITPEVAEVQEWSVKVALVMEDEFQISMRRPNEHMFLFAQLLCALAGRGGRFGSSLPQVLQMTFAAMPVGHRDRDRALCSYFRDFAPQSAVGGSLTNGPWAELLLWALLADDGQFPTARPLVIAAFRNSVHLYATASRFLRVLATRLEAITPLDGRLLAELLALMAPKSASVAKDIEALAVRPGVLAKCLAAGRSARITDLFFAGLVAFLADLLTKANPKTLAAIAGDSDWLRTFADAAAFQDAETRATAIRILVMALKHFRGGVVAACADVVLAEKCALTEVAPWVAAWVEATDADGFMPRKCGEEFAAAVTRAESAADLASVFRALSTARTITRVPDFVAVVAKSGCLARLVALGGQTAGVQALARSITDAHTSSEPG
jgi:hypothetical protein